MAAPSGRAGSSDVRGVVFKTREGLGEVAASWAAIIDEARFSRVQEMLKSNKGRKKPPAPNRYPYLLSGLVLCKTCGDRMSGKSAHGNGGKIGYYEHSWATKTHSCLSKKVFACEPHRILAKKIEPVVWADVKRLLTDDDYMRLIFEEAKAHARKFSKPAEIERMQAKISSLQQQIEATTERVSELPKGINAQVFFDQILKLQKAKEDFEVKLAAIKAENMNQESPLNVVGLSYDKTVDFSSTKIQMISRIQHLPLVKQESFLRAKHESEGLSVN